jgi:lysophospholipid acyltransferase (LPLAT)-like uncharacterized protein
LTAIEEPGEMPGRRVIGTMPLEPEAKDNPLVQFREIRHWLLLGLIRTLGVAIIRAWMRTLRIEAVWAEPKADPLICRDHGQYIYAIWHEDQLVTGCKYGPGRIWAIISQSRDGEYAARIMAAFGWRLIRGSTTRGAVSVLKKVRELANSPEPFRLALAVDGPRGPHRQVKEGVIYLAAKTGLPIVPVASGYDRPWRARSWDRFALPRPFRRVVVLAGAPISVPPDTSREEFASFRNQLQACLEQLSRDAQQRASQEPTIAVPRSPDRCAA